MSQSMPRRSIGGSLGLTNKTGGNLQNANNNETANLIRRLES